MQLNTPYEPIRGTRNSNSCGGSWDDIPQTLAGILAPTAESWRDRRVGVAFYFLSLALEDLPVGVVYGTWAALGIVAIAAIGAIVFDEPVDTAGIVDICLIIAGVYCLNLVSAMSAH